MARNERAAAIVASAFIENNLALAILSRLRELNGKQEDELFGSEQAPFSTFHEKIHIGFALALYPKGARDDLLIIKAVRNRFAHYLNVRHFSNEWVSAQCANLRYPAWHAKSQIKPEITAPRERFMDTAHHFIDGLALTARHPERPTPATFVAYA